MVIKMNAIEIRNLSKSFRGMYAVDHLSMTVPQGAIYGSLGGGMLLFMMVSMITPLGSTMINVALCAAGGALFAFGLGAISKGILKKTSLV
jgi:ABC-type Na+ transport system ATPase subunit NatA